MLRAALTIALVLGVFGATAAARKSADPIPTVEPPRAVDPRDGSLSFEPRFAMAAANTTLLASYDFDSGGICDPQGWTVHDATEQVATFWHVEDFVGANVNPGDSLAVLAGSKSLWCGARAAPLGLTCGYLALPGYGNSWDQVWQTKTCIPVTGNLDVSFMIETDAEPNYDTTYLEVTADCTGPTYVGWYRIDGGLGEWDGVHDAITHVASYAGVPASVKVRLHFESDGGWSDQDDLYDSHAGPIVIDNLVVEGLALEDFENEALGATTTGDWEAFLVPGYGASYMAQFRGDSQVQQDACATNVSCLWAAIFGSPWTYACGGFPLQKAVPRGNGRDQYIHAEIWSPAFPLVGTGSVVNLEFAVYRDLEVDNFVFYDWGVRSINAGGCANPWRDRNFVYYGDTKDWFVAAFPAGDLVYLSHASIQVKIGVVDMCGYWCNGTYGGSCHSHAPLIDNVRVYRVDIFGPTFAVRDLEQFQDTFPTDGSDSGTGRADAAVSWQADASLTNIPADSATLICLDGITRYPAEVGGDPVTGDRSGLAVDPELGGWQVYCWVRVIDSGVPQVVGPKFGVGLQELPRYPFKDTQVADGKTWTRIRCDRANNAASRWRIDFPDALFTAGDVIEYFFGATSTSGLTSYCSGSALTFVQNDAGVAAAAPSEFTILPLVPGAAGTDILYVDGMDGRGAQQYWEASFATMGVTPDRFDIRAPSSGVGNHPGARVEDVIAQLNGNYRKILFDCGNLTNIVSDGTQNDKSDDYAMINVFLTNLGSPGGVYIGGDDAPENLAATMGGSAAMFKSAYLTSVLTTGNAKPTFGVAPIVTGMPAGADGQGAFAGQQWVAYGGCPSINDFDVMAPTGSSVLQSTYGANAGDNGADISKNTANARVLMAGYAFQDVKDYEIDGVYDRDRYLYDILLYLGSPDSPTDATPLRITRLEQNYPNPFNPQTTIAFSIKQRARVKIDVYNVAGERVRTLLDETRAAGSYTDLRWDGTDAAGSPVASGVYFYKLAAPDFSQTRKMVLLK